MELARADEPTVELTSREQVELARVRRKSATLHRAEGMSLMANARRHAFKLIIAKGSRVAVCLACEGRESYEPTATGKNDHFLGNFWTRHLTKADSGHACSPAPTSSTPTPSMPEEEAVMRTNFTDQLRPRPVLSPGQLERLAADDNVRGNDGLSHLAAAVRSRGQRGAGSRGPLCVVNRGLGRPADEVELELAVPRHHPGAAGRRLD